MSTSLIALLIFGSFIFAVAMLAMAVQQTAAWVGQRGASTADAPMRLRRIMRPGRGKEESGPVARFDSWFEALLRESGTLWEPISASLMLVLLGTVGAAIGYLWKEDVAVATGGFLVGMGLPLLYLLQRQRRRTRQLQDQLPSCLEMLARSVRAGESLDQALKVVGKQGPEPLANEFRWCATQLEMGLSMASVMRLLMERIQLQDVRIFTTALTVHRQTGGNVAKVLARLANVVRNRLSYRRQLRVATAAGRASAILVGIIGPMIFLFFLAFQTEYLDAMLHSPLGQSLLLAAATLEVIGLIWTWRLLKPAY